MSQPVDRSQPGPYKVILVEDEVVAREGIRDNVNWATCGFAFAGEASDGEAALPVIEQMRPDVLITDIRMPFMDGLQLTREVRRRYPETRVLILSGYDDFSFAQTAIHLGVVEYLLKPVSARDMERALLRMKALLDTAWAASRDQVALRRQAGAGAALRRDTMLLRICLGDVDPFELQEQAPALGIVRDAACWVVLVARIDAAAGVEPRRLRELQALLEPDNQLPGVYSFRKDIEELVVLVCGDDEAEVQQRACALRDALHAVQLPQPGCRVDVGIGALRRELGAVPFSFAEALHELERVRTLAAASAAGAVAAAGAAAGATARSAAGAGEEERPLPTHALRDLRWPIDRRALDSFLHHGSLGDFESFYAAYARPPESAAAGLHRLYTYLILDVTLAAASFVAELGGEVAAVLPEAGRVDALWEEIRSDADLRALVRSIVERALEYRDQVARSSHAQLVRRVRAQLAEQFADPELSLQRVAADAHLSPSHFSVVFGRETGETFKSYLTRVRMQHARELLRSTPLAVTEVARRCGYPDPHYFSSAFKRVCGVSPRDFREAEVA